MNRMIVNEIVSEVRLGNSSTNGLRLQFLGKIGGDKAITPRFIAGDAIQGLIAFEYVSKAHSFRDILRKSNAAERTHALLAHAQAMGRMHGSTYGRKNEWLSLRRSLEPITTQT